MTPRSNTAEIPPLSSTEAAPAWQPVKNTEMEEGTRFAELVVTSFLTELQSSIRRMDSTVDVAVQDHFRAKLGHFLASEIKGFDECFNTITGGNKVVVRQLLLGRLRYFLKMIIPFDVRTRLHRNKYLLEIHRFLFAPHDSRVVQFLREAGHGILALLPVLLPLARVMRRVTGINTTFMRMLSEMSPEILRDMARRLVEADPEKFLKAEKDAADFNALPGKKKCLFVSHLFATTWAPTVRALNDAGWVTGWLGNNDVQEFGSYGVMTTKQIPATGKFAESFLGTLIFMARMKDTRVLLSGECYYGANWNGEDAWVLFTIMGTVTKTIRQCRPPGLQNLFLLMYDGLKPVAKSGQLKQEISKAYGEMMRSADKIIYNSNTEYFGEYVENAYGVTAPRLHFYRFSETPKNPKPRLGFGPNGDEFHMACITVALAEFGEPSRDAVPNFVRNIIEQGVHFHYYCRADDPVIYAFRNSIAPAYRQYFHPHPVNKDQQQLVDELHQYHVAFNPSDHIPFSKGISQLNDREYQDGMSVFWQSTVGTSFLVYAAAGLPFVLPRGCTGSIQHLIDTAIPVTLAEYKNLKNHFKKIDLPARCQRVEEGSPAGWVDTYIQRLIDFIE
jgi:hypothetical protein